MVGVAGWQLHLGIAFFFFSLPLFYVYIRICYIFNYYIIWRYWLTLAWQLNGLLGLLFLDCFFFRGSLVSLSVMVVSILEHVGFIFC